MYNRYIPSGTSYTRIPEEDAPQTDRPPQGQKKPTGGGGGSPPPPHGPGDGGGTPSGIVERLLRALKLEDLDAGDLLLLLIVLLLLVEGDDLELVIALGLVLILGLDDET